VGIGCDSWPDCYGILDPAGEKKGVTVLTEQGRDMGHRDARLAHRYIASTLGIFIIALFAASLRRKDAATGLLVPLALLLITIFLSLLGYYTPTRDNPLITMGNLLGGMAMLALLWWMMQRYAEDITATAPVQLRPLVLVALLLIITQILLGGWSSANYATGASGEQLACEQSWFSAANFSDAYNPARAIPLDASGQVQRQSSLGALSMTHRIFALFTAAYLAWMVRRLKPQAALRNSAIATSVFSIGLILAGVSMIWLDLPLLLVSLHSSLAAGLLLSCVQLLHLLTPGRKQ
jgi:cytochrome c oxidase assembly protein subunit 15